VTLTSIDARTLATALAVLEWTKTIPPSAQHQPPLDYSTILDARLSLGYALKTLQFEVRK
jgi:hypothetical protein